MREELKPRCCCPTPSGVTYHPVRAANVEVSSCFNPIQGSQIGRFTSIRSLIATSARIPQPGELQLRDQKARCLRSRDVERLEDCGPKCQKSTAAARAMTLPPSTRLN